MEKGKPVRRIFSDNFYHKIILRESSKCAFPVIRMKYDMVIYFYMNSPVLVSNPGHKETYIAVWQKLIL